MRVIRIYQAGDFAIGQTLALSPEASQHVGVVLRMQPSDRLLVFDGENREWDASIVAVHKKQVTICLHAVQIISRESPCAIHLVQAIPKGDRMDWIVQKATELGVATITPLITAHSALKWDAAGLEKKCNKWQSVAIAASEQCGRNHIMSLSKPVIFSTYLQQQRSGSQYMLHPQAGKTWRDIAGVADDVHMLVGPEGGFREDEVQAALDAGFQPLQLGPRILRTETAAIAALTLLQAVAGDL